MNSKWIPDLNAKYKTIKNPTDNMGENLDNLGFGDDFLGTTQKAQSMKEITDKLYIIKIKIFCSAEDNVKKIRRWAKDWEKIFATDI